MTMKATQLIAALAKAIEKYGDLEVAFHDGDEEGGPIGRVRRSTKTEMEDADGEGANTPWIVLIRGY